MLSVAISLDRIHCHVQNDNFFSSEPYLWTVFFHADINTATLGQGNRLATYTPGSDWTTRGMYPDGVEAGDDIGIPWSLGKRRFTLDDGGLGIAVCGVLYLLLEQDQTPGDAIKAGHRALADAADVVLNSYVDSKYPAVAEPTPAEIKVMADQIQGEVTDAIKHKLSWYDALNDQDDFFGFGYQFLSHAELSSLASQSPPVRQGFSTRIRSLPQLPAFENDYEIFGGVSARQYSPPPGPFQQELDTYHSAIGALKDVDKNINQVGEGLRDKSGAERMALLAEMDELQRSIRPQALAVLVSARAAFEQRRDSVSTTSGDYVESKERLRKAREDRITQLRPSRFRESAVVVSPSMSPPLSPETPEVG
jgi:hypothetical protein